MGENPLGYEKESKLLRELAIPCIISMLVSALYNIAFPLSTISAAVSLLIGVGGASRFSLKLGAGEKEEADTVVFLFLVRANSAAIYSASFLVGAVKDS